MGINAFIERIHSAGLKVFFFVDMIVLPLKVIDNYKEQILNKDGIIVFNDVTAKILTAIFTDTLQRFPSIDGFVIRIQAPTFLEEFQGYRPHPLTPPIIN